MSDKTKDLVPLKPALGDGSIVNENGYHIKKPSAVLHNNTGNNALKGQGSVAIGAGVVAQGVEQTVIGRHNKPNPNDIIQVGGGDSNGQNTVYRVTNDGVAMNHGGQVYTKCGNEIRFVSLRSDKGEPMRYDEVQLIGE